ncbi:CXXC zinc finger domain protein, partial [Teladorsagia circumcincta]
CGVCRGCQCKPCGQCTYCQDSPQFGGPGVKKQSCIERRCLRVLENRLQRDAPTFKARVGCNQCEDCRMPDCQICLAQKRAYDQGAPPPIHFDMKRRGMDVNYGMSMSQLQGHQQQVQQQLGHPHAQQNARILAINPAVNYGESLKG